jgi:hypothetical protein
MMMMMAMMITFIYSLIQTIFHYAICTHGDGDDDDDDTNDDDTNDDDDNHIDGLTLLVSLYIFFTRVGSC